jgi:hypothetical protein
MGFCQISAMESLHLLSFNSKYQRPLRIGFGRLFEAPWRKAPGAKKKQQDSNNPKQTDRDIGFLFCLYHDIA